MITVGLSGTSDLMNCEEDVKVLAWLSVRLVPYSSMYQLSWFTPIDASSVP